MVGNRHHTAAVCSAAEWELQRDKSILGGREEEAEEEEEEGDIIILSN